MAWLHHNVYTPATETIGATSGNGGHTGSRASRCEGNNRKTKQTALQICHDTTTGPAPA